MTRRALAAAAVASCLAGCGESSDPPPPAQPVCPAAQVGLARPRAQCGAALDFTPINAYHGDFATAQDREDAVVLINGTCTGTLIAAAAGPVVITAGHCAALGDRALLAFNVEVRPDGDPLITQGTVIEQADEPDYALIALDALPEVVPTVLTGLPSDRLAIIQHPRGGPKVIAEGDFLGECRGLISYVDLDTLVGSSGAGVLTDQGQLYGVHTDGDCGTDGSGSNTGWSAARIVEASPYLEVTDLAVP